MAARSLARCRSSPTSMKAIDISSWPLKARKETTFLEDIAVPDNIAAIDFGTTYCSLVYKTEGDERIYPLKLNAIHERVPTAILLKVLSNYEKDESVQCDIKEFGSRARAEYSKLKSKDRSDYIYFERIKMKLHHEEEVDRNMCVKDLSGQDFYLMEVIAFILKYLKNQLVDHLSRTVKPLMAHDFKWVITVPAIWRSRGRHMMREAAYLAGLCTSDNPGITTMHHATERGLRSDFKSDNDNLTLCLEPEVAAIYCQSLTSDEIAEYCSGISSAKSKKCMVLDIGGGTVDLTAQQFDHGLISVIDIPSGNDCGGTMVNEQFSKLLQDILDDPEFKRFLDSASTDKAKLALLIVLNRLIYEEFEEEKIKFGERYSAKGDISNKEFEAKIEIPKEIVSFYTRENEKKLIDKIAADIEFEDDTLYIKFSKFESLFKPAIEGIIQCTLDCLSRLSGQVDTIYFVGGFGGCRYVYESVEKAVIENFGERQYKLIAPTHHKIAVAHGAVLYRSNPDMVHSRKVDGTYGLCVSVPYRHPPHSVDYRYYDDDGDAICRYAFLTFVNKNDTVSIGEKFVAHLQPESQKQRDFKIAVYSSPNSCTYFMDAAQEKQLAAKVGEVHIALPQGDFLHKDQRQFEVTLVFSGTEIQASVKYLDTKEEVKAPIDFLSSRL